MSNRGYVPSIYKTDTLFKFQNVSSPARGGGTAELLCSCLGYGREKVEGFVEIGDFGKEKILPMCPNEGKG